MTAHRPASLRMLGLVAGAVAATVVLGSCAPLGQLAGVGGEAHDPAEIVETMDCASFADATFLPPEDAADLPSPRPLPAAGSVPGDFVPVEVITCDPMQLVETEVDGELWWGVPQERLTGDLAPLLEQFDQASDAPWQGACTADMEVRPVVWLVDRAGEAMIARWPIDGCGKSKTDVFAALATLDRVEASVAPVAPRRAPAPGEELCVVEPGSPQKGAAGDGTRPVAPEDVPAGSSKVPIPPC